MHLLSNRRFPVVLFVEQNNGGGRTTTPLVYRGVYCGRVVWGKVVEERILPDTKALAAALRRGGSAANMIGDEAAATTLRLLS